MNNENRQKIIAVVVTYNRLVLLKKVIENLAAQTLAITKIIVVNNSSVDGTEEWLNTQDHLFTITQENTGGAGGFYTGVKYAFENGADWIWLMDDDIVPEKNCLEHLLKYQHISKCMQPIRYDAEGELLDEERFLDVLSGNIASSLNISFKQGKKFWLTNIGCFEGMLISSEIVREIGFPDKRFFIAHDDLIYGYLASKHTNNIVVADAVMKKQPVPVNTNNFRYLYYSHRNLWLINEYLTKDFPEFKKYRRRRTIFKFYYSAYRILRSAEYKNKRKALKILMKAFIDFKRKKEGQSF